MKYELLDCIKDKPKLFEKFKRAISTLQEVSDSLRRSWDEFDDDEIEIVQKICTRWGEHWTKDFPHLNITPKAHDLILVISEFLRRTTTFHMFYKFEERSESIHADFNTIQRKIWCIRQPEQRLWKFIERLVIFFLVSLIEDGFPMCTLVAYLRYYNNSFEQLCSSSGSS